MQILNPEPATAPSGLQVLVSVGPGGDAFELGAAAGALAVLAVAMNLTCVVKDHRSDGGMQLQLDRVAAADRQTGAFAGG
jgi:hypothetical protein